MVVRVAPGAEHLAGDLDGPFLLLVRGAADQTLAAAALQAARDDLLALADGPSSELVVSNAVLGPDGPLLRVHAPDVPPDVLDTVPDLVVHRLTEAGVAAASVDVLEPGGVLDDLDRTPSAVVLRLFPMPGDGADRGLPPSWIDLAADWVLGDLDRHDEVRLRLLGAPATVGAADAPATLHHAARARAWCDLVHGDLRDRIRTASLSFGSTPHLALAAGGPGCDDAALLARFDLLCDLAREVDDDVAYACVDIEATFEDVGFGLPSTSWSAHGGAPANEVVARAGDVRVPGAFPFQVLGPGHLARLAEVRPGRPPGRALPGGRAAVSLGKPVDWAPLSDAREAAAQRARTRLAGLLVTDDELARVVDERAATADPASRPPRAGPVGTGPDLDAIVLEAAPHPRRGLRLTFLELASWLGHEPHSDDPVGVSPVLAAYARWLASALDDERRQQLVRRAPLVVGTRSPSLAHTGDDWRPLPQDDEARVHAAVEWLLRVQAPAWLTAAGHAAAAKRVTSSRRLRGDPLAGATDRVGAALDELLALDLRSGGGAGADRRAEDVAWRAWERAAERSGWVAASEAASLGLPRVLADAIELRVVALARDGEPSGSPIADEARLAGREAVAQAAWEAGWDAARAAVDPSAFVSLAVASRRARSAAATRLELDADALDAALDVAHAAARAELAGAIERRDDGARGWGRAITAAQRSAGGKAWTLTQELVVGALDADVWAKGQAAASLAAARALETGPALIDRAAAVALARETAGSAARLVAREAAAAALTDGDPERAAEAAADAALEPTAAALTDQAIELLDRLI